MRTVSKKFFAQECGVSGAAITKAGKAGRIALEGKYVNYNDPLTQAYLRKKKGLPPLEELTKKKQVNTGLEEVKTKTKPKKQAIKKKTKTAPAIKHPETLPAIALPQLPSPSPIIEDIDLGNLSDDDIGSLGKHELDRLKTIEQTLAIRQKTEVVRGNLIPRSIVKTVFAKIHAVDNAEFKTMEDRLTPAICGVFGESDDSENALKIRKMLNKEIIKTLRHTKRIINEFLVRSESGAL